MKRFGASQELCLAGLTFYLLGLAFGPALSGPLSEVFGRKTIVHVLLTNSHVVYHGCRIGKNIETILVLRFFLWVFRVQLWLSPVVQFPTVGPLTLRNNPLQLPYSVYVPFGSSVRPLLVGLLVNIKVGNGLLLGCY